MMFWDTLILKIFRYGNQKVIIFTSKRGRLSLTVRALVIQKTECIEEYVLSDTESESEVQKPKAKVKRFEIESDNDYDIFNDDEEVTILHL